MSKPTYRKSNRYRSNKRYTKKRNKNRYTKKRYTKKRHTKKRHTKRRYTKKNINKNVRKYLGGDPPYVDITTLLENTPRTVPSPKGRKLFCARNNTLLKFGNENEDVTCVDKNWGKCVENLSTDTINKYLINEGVYSGNSAIPGNISEILRNSTRTLNAGIFIENNDEFPKLERVGQGGDTSDELDSVKDYWKQLIKLNGEDVFENDVIDRIILSIDTTLSVSMWDFLQEIHRELVTNGGAEGAIAMPGEARSLIKYNSDIVLTFNYYYIQTGCEWTHSVGGNNRSNLIVRSYNTYNLKNNKEWNSFNIQILPLNPESLGNTINDIIESDKDFRDGVMEAVKVMEKENLKTIIDRFPKLTESTLSDEEQNKIAEHYCSTDSLSVDYDISLLETIMTKTKGITNILRNLEEIRSIIETREDPTCRMKMINTMVDKPIHDDINNLLLTNPDANIYDWLSTSDFTSGTGGKRAQFNYEGTDYDIPLRTITANNWINHWNTVTRQTIHSDAMPHTIARGGADAGMDAGMSVEEEKKAEIRRVIARTPAANIYDWLSTSALISQSEKEPGTHVNYNRKRYYIPLITILPGNFNDWIKHWNDVTGEDIPFFGLPEDSVLERSTTI